MHTNIQEQSKCLLVNVQHIIIYLGGYLHLWQKTSENNYKEIAKTATAALQEAYEVAKVKAHIPVYLGMILNDHVHGSTSWETMQLKLASLLLLLKQLLNASAKASTDYPDELISPSVVTILQAQSCNNIEMIKQLCNVYVKSMQPILKRYGKEAASLQIKSMDDIISYWQEAHHLNIKSSRTLIIGGKRPRKGMIEMQYIQNCYDEKGIPEAEENDYLIYVEATYQMEQHIQIKDLIPDIGVHIYNRRIGLLIENDKDALNKDILEEHAPHAIKELKDQKKVSCPFGYDRS
jgi:hypothetical protein